MEEKLIAPCGMNCGICVSFLAKKNNLNKKGFKKTYCSGCLPSERNCTLKNHCELVAKGVVRFCYECGEFPCSRLKSLDKRYRIRYHMSMLENLELIKERSISRFLENEVEKWRCSECGEFICCHNGLCLNCDLDKLRQNKRYRWEEGL